MRALLVALAAWLTGSLAVALVLVGLALVVVMPERVAAVAWLLVIAGAWAAVLARHLVDAYRQELAR